MREKSATLLIVDDTDLTRRMLSRLLQQAGFQTLEAHDGATALWLVQQQPDLVLLDINLPDIDGYEVCRRIKADPILGSIPILQISATQIGPRETAHGLEGGADAYLTHPVDTRILIATIRALLRTHWAETQLRQAQAELEQRVLQRTQQLLQANSDLQAEIARRQEVEASLRVLTANLEQANRDLQDFASVVSHDLLEPLRSVRVFSERLQARCKDSIDPDGQLYLTRILAATGRMRQMVVDLLEVGRAASGTGCKPPTPVDLGQTVSQVLENLQRSIEETGAKITVCPLPVIKADSTQMGQLFQNLIGNALKFHTPGQAPVIVIKSSVLEGQSRCQIEVQDNGIGFDEEDGEVIFGVFQRIHSRHQYEGSGVGLSICRKIVERHGGTISAHSGGGMGATFVVVLPVE